MRLYSNILSYFIEIGFWVRNKRGKDIILLSKTNLRNNHFEILLTKVTGFLLHDMGSFTKILWIIKMILSIYDVENGKIQAHE